MRIYALSTCMYKCIYTSEHGAGEVVAGGWGGREMGGGELWSSAPEEHPSEKVEEENF